MARRPTPSGIRRMDLAKFSVLLMLAALLITLLLLRSAALSNLAL